MRTELPPPADWQEFENLCWTLWKRIWNDPNAQCNGRTGQAQDGVDIYGRFNGVGLYQGIQCKRLSATLSQKVTKAILREEVERAKAFTPRLGTLIVATTAPHDAPILKEARHITAEHETTGLFTVHVMGWEEIVARLREYPDLYAGYLAAVIGLLIVGLPSFPNACTTRVTNFLHCYLGTGTRPEPFGGRGNALSALDDWLADPAQPAYRLLTGPAGRGKSALLAHWVTRLRGRDDLKIVYFPISLRFLTNREPVILQALAARLAHVHGEIAPTGLQDSPAVWRELVADYASRPLSDGRTLLVVLDGLDEADGWTTDAGLFPPGHPPGLRVLIAVRAHPRAAGDWLHRLGWQRPGTAEVQGLEALTREGVRDVLKGLGCPLDTLAADIDLIGALHRLSEGDPLLVKLYVEDLQRRGEAAARLRPEELQAIPPGLSGYFQHWWEEQRTQWRDRDPLAEERTRAVLAVLACALGPLPADDVIELMPPGTELSRQDLRNCLEPLARFVIGDGREQGYVLAHPRFGDHLREEMLTKSERTAVEARFLDWGRRVLAALREGMLAPERTPPYAVRHFGAHLHRASATAEQQLALVAEPWHKAWHTLEGSYQGFLADVDRAWSAAARENTVAIAAGRTPPHLGGEMQCALCRSSIGTLSANLHPKLLRQLLNDGLWSRPQVLAYLRQTTDEEATCRAIRDLGTDAPSALVQELLTVARDLRSPMLRTEAFHALLEHFAGSERQQLASEILAAQQSEGNPNRWWDSVETLAPDLDDIQVEGLLSLARAIADNESRAIALTTLVPKRGDLFDEAWDAARGIDRIGSRISYLTSLLTIAPQDRTPELVSEVLELFRSAPFHEVELFRFERFAQVIAAFENEAVWTSVKATALEIELVDRVEVLASLAKLRPDGLWEPLFKLLRVPGGGRDACLALSGLAERIPDVLIDTAVDCASSLRDAGDKVEALHALARRGHSDLFAQSLEIVAAILDEHARSRHLADLVPDLPASLLDRAHEQAKGLEDPEHRAIALIALAARRPDCFVPEALATIDEMDTYQDWCHALLTLVDKLPPSHREAVALEAVEKLVKAKPFTERSFALSYLVEFVPALERRRVLDAALSAGLTIEDGKHWTWTLINAMGQLPEELLDEGLTYARGLVDSYGRAAALANLCGRRPVELLDETWEAIQQVQVVAKRLDLIGLVLRYAPEPLRAEMAEAAFESMSANKHQINSVFSFCRFVEHIPDSRLDEARQRATRNGEGYYAAMERAAFARRVPDPERSALVLDVLRMREGFRDEAAGCWVLSELPRPLPPGVLDDAVQRAQRLAKPRERLSALLSLRNDLPADLRQSILTEAVERAERFPKEKDLGQLAGISDDLPEDLAPRAFDVVRRTPGQDQMKTLWRLSRRLAAIPSGRLYPIWHEALFHFSRSKRGQLSEAVAALMPMTEVMGGRAAIADVWRTVTTTVRWWP